MDNYIDAYYIDPNSGNDNNRGTINSPFKTIQKGINVAETNNNDGNRIYLKDGTYYLNQSLEINRGGSSNAYLSIQPLSGNKVVLDGRNVSEWRNIINIRDADRVNIKGLEIRNAPSHGIEVVNGSHVNITDNLIHDTKGMGIRVRGYMAELPETEGNTYVQSSHVIIKDNGVYKTNLSNSGSREGSGNWGAAIQAWNANQVKIVNNTVGENYGEGIGLTMVNNGVVAKNHLFSNYSVQLYLDNVTDSLIESNYIHNNGDRRFYRNNSPANGIGMANEIHNVANPSRFYLNNNQIKHNVINGADIGIIYGTWGGIHQSYANNWRGLKNTVISNNTVHGSKYKSLKFFGDSNNSNVKVSQNIFSQNSLDDLSDVDDLTGISFRRNLWYGGRAGEGYSSTDILKNPLLASPGGYNVWDYRLQSNSPAIDAVNSGNNVWVTDGQADLGALEFGQPVFDVGN
jgi:parallel beta-helix repeat protein